MVGKFDEKYLELPEEVLLTVLKTQGNLIWLKPTNKFAKRVHQPFVVDLHISFKLF